MFESHRNLLSNPLSWNLYSAIVRGHVVEFVQYFRPRNSRFECQVWIGDKNQFSAYWELINDAQERGLQRYGVIHIDNDENWVVLKHFKTQSIFIPWRIGSYDALSKVLELVQYIRACTATSKPRKSNHLMFNAD